MDFFTYPVESKQLLRKKMRIKQQLLGKNIQFVEKKIAVLGGSTTNEIVDQLELFLLNYGIKPTFYQSEYAQYWQDAVFGNEELDSFRPDVVFIHTTVIMGNGAGMTAYVTICVAVVIINMIGY